MQAQLDGIHGPERQRVTLTAREGQVQLVLTNDTGRPADVTLELRGDRLVFPDHPDGRMPVRLEPGDDPRRPRACGPARRATPPSTCASRRPTAASTSAESRDHRPHHGGVAASASS